MIVSGERHPEHASTPMTTELDKALSRLEQWVVPQLKRLADTLQAVPHGHKAEAMIESRAGTARLACPNYGTPDVTRWGMNAGREPAGGAASGMTNTQR
jgi:hypothetical protein